MTFFEFDHFILEAMTGSVLTRLRVSATVRSSSRLQPLGFYSPNWAECPSAPVDQVWWIESASSCMQYRDFYSTCARTFVPKTVRHRFHNDSSCHCHREEVHSNMSPQERLKSWIDTLDDPELLEVLDDIRRSRTDSDWWTTLTETDILSVQKGLSDLDCSRTVNTRHLLSKLRDATPKS